MYMRGETQADHLEEMMRKHPLFTYYELTLPSVALKRTNRKKLKAGDLILLHQERPSLTLYLDGCHVAKVQLDRCQKSISVLELYTDSERESLNEKKYEILRCSFGNIQSKALSKGMKLDISELDLTKLTLFVEGEAVAEGRPVWVENELAVEIIKVEE